jgi:pSer/pThr/pTyr-binding forkhead associated (FHA) protein
MELFEKINRAFGGWYEGLFGGSDDLRPKDILRRIFTAMEENRKEHLDDKIYVPNHYILEIAVDDEEEKEFLRSFLVREELETAVRRYCKQNHYEVRGGLQFTIREVEPEPESAARRSAEKVRIRCRYDSSIPVAEPPALPLSEPIPAAPTLSGLRPVEDDEGRTVASVYGNDEEGTVPAVALARLKVTTPARPPYNVSIAKTGFTIGRSPNAGNDVVLEDDVRVSRRHARIELDADGKFTVYDLDSTNGTRVNGKKIDNCALHTGDEIRVGDSRLQFEQLEDEESEPSSAPPRRMSVPAAGSAPRLILMDGDRDVDDYVLGSETIVGRGPTNDVVLDDRSVATRHVRIMSGEPYVLEVLDPDHLTLHNGSQLRPGASVELHSGDRIGLGNRTLRFVREEASA